MDSKRALIFAGGRWHSDGSHSHLLDGPWNWIVCADSGLHHALNQGFRPDLLVGDLDSVSDEDRNRRPDIPYFQSESDQDKTDTHIAVDWVLDQGARDVVIAGGLGSRFDHSLANAQLLLRLHPKAQGVVTDGKQSAYLLVNQLRLQASPGTVLSVLPLSTRLEGLTIVGARWELHDRTVSLGDTLTVSNEFGPAPVHIQLSSGLGLVIVGAYGHGNR